MYRVGPDDEERVLAPLDHREQGGYERLILAAIPLDGSAPITATTWIATPENPYHLGPAPLSGMVAQIRAAVGPSGPNVEYVLRLAEALRAMELDDPHVDEIARALDAG